MLLQRLTYDDQIGYNYDYMGSVEYENGATLEGRLAIAHLFIEGEMKARKCTFQEKMGKMLSEPIEVLAIGSEEMLNRLGNEIIIPVTKEAFRVKNLGIAGWLHVPHSGKVDENYKPLLLVRTDCEGESASDRVQKFLAGAIHAIREDVKPVPIAQVEPA